ncbi:MAG: SDR family NAD(P)-dependent oxidoreductase [Microthrixaceae bacterium]
MANGNVAGVAPPEKPQPPATTRPPSHADSPVTRPPAPDRLDGSVAVITGANSGVGLETAVALAARGARVIGAVRNRAKGERALELIAQRSGSDSVEMRPLDLADLTTVTALADSLDGQPIDLLINNAGIIQGRRTETAQGFETTFGVNHLGHFLLTRLLLPGLRGVADPTPADPLERRAIPSRIINLASGAHHAALRGIRFDRLDRRTGRFWNTFGVYGESKLANVLFTRSLADRLDPARVVAHSVHPGGVATEFGMDGDVSSRLERWIRPVEQRVLLTPEQGAETSVFVATSVLCGRSSGTYWVRKRPGTLSRWAKSTEHGEHLWALSERLLAQAGFPVPPVPATTPIVVP